MGFTVSVDSCHITASADIDASEVHIVDIAPVLDVFHPYRNLDLFHELDHVSILRMLQHLGYVNSYPNLLINSILPDSPKKAKDVL